MWYVKTTGDGFPIPDWPAGGLAPMDPDTALWHLFDDGTEILREPLRSLVAKREEEAWSGS